MTSHSASSMVLTWRRHVALSSVRTFFG